MIKHYVEIAGKYMNNFSFFFLTLTVFLFPAAEELTMGGMKFKTFDLGGHKQGL